MAQAIPIGCTSPVIMTSSLGYIDTGNTNPGLISSPTFGPYHLIDASMYGGTVIFQGDYFITRPLRLVNGTFIFNPGTTMNFRASLGAPGPGVCPVYAMPNDRIFMEVQNAQVRATATTFTNDGCGHIWGGIYLRGQAVIATDNCQINFAHIGLAMDNNCNSANNNRYYITQTTFTDNVTGIWDRNKTATVGEGAQDCIFQTTLTPLPVNYYAGGTDYGRTGIRFDNNAGMASHDYAQAIFDWNEFHNLAEYGMYGVARNLNISNSTFTRIGNTSINIHSDLNTAPTISGGFIEVRAGQYPMPGSPTTIAGVQYSPRVKIIGLIITGAGTLPSAPNPGARRIGVWLDGLWNGSPVLESTQIESSRFANLQEGIAINNNTDYWMTSELNIFEDNLVGINVDNSATAPNADLYARCNTFRRSSTPWDLIGINVTNNTYLNTIESGTPGSGGPAGNSFLGLSGGTYYPIFKVGPIVQYYGYGNFSDEDMLGYLMLSPGANFNGLAYTPPAPSTTLCAGLGAGVQRQAQQTQQAELGLAKPNPATHVVIIPYELPESYQRAELEVRELVTGRTVSHSRLSNNTRELKLATDSFASGCYTYALLIDGATVATNKLVVIK